MCKGIAILINDNTIVMNEKESSHSSIKGCKEDNFLKINVIYDDREKRGYRFEIDNHGESQLQEYKEKAFITKSGKLLKSYEKRLNEFCKENEHKFFRLFCRLLHSATIEGNQYNYLATIKGDQSNRLATIKGDQDNHSATIKGDQYNRLATIKGDQSNRLATIKGNQSNDSATIKGDQYNYSATIKGNQDNDSATIEGNQYNRLATIKGNQYNYSATIEGDIFIYNMKHGDTEFQKLLDCFSKSCNSYKEATLVNFVKWIQNKDVICRKRYI